MYTVGQKLYFVPAYNARPYDVTISKVGRKWLHCQSFGQSIRVDAKTLRPHEDDARGCFYHSQAEYEQRVAPSQAWDEFRRTVARGYSVPDGVTVEKIQQATALLFGEHNVG